MLSVTSDPSYKKVHKNFLPINYKFMGIDQISLTNRFDLFINIDADYILEIQSRNVIPAVRVPYLTIGEKSNVVCSECDNFIFRDSCLDVCPNNTY